MSKLNIKIAVKVVCIALSVLAWLAVASPQAQTPPADEALKAFLQTKAEDKETRYVAVLRDLNGDGTPEAIAYLVGGDWCGTGGCNLFVLQKHGDSWKIVSSVTITYPPVRLLTTTSNDWRDLSVQIGGGGARAGAVNLRFNGKTYRKSPSASGRGKDPSGDVIIRSWDGAKPLF